MSISYNTEHTDTGWSSIRQCQLFIILGHTDIDKLASDNVNYL